MYYSMCVCTGLLVWWLLLQVNPLAEDESGALIAADAKLGFDDNAAYRQKDIFAMEDESQLDPRCGGGGVT